MSGTGSRFDVRGRLLMHSLVSLLGMILIVLFFANSTANVMMEERKMHIHDLLDTVHGQLTYYHELHQQGVISLQEAQKRALESMRVSRYGESGYFWVTDFEGLMLMHTTHPDMEGKNLRDQTMLNGRLVWSQLIKARTVGHSWVVYPWPNPATGIMGEKLSHVDPFEPWGWVVGTGLYVDDVSSEITMETLHIYVMIFVTLALLVVLSYFISKRYMSDLSDLASRDQLTGLYSRHFLHDSIPLLFGEHDRNPEKVMGLIFIDIDHFKKVNDMHGHGCGDMVLVQLASKLTENARQGDLAVRFGGEEMLLLTTSSSADEIMQIARRIHANVEAAEFVCEKLRLKVTVSMGVAMRQPEEEIGSLLNRADKLLYEAKAAGRNCIRS